MILIDYCKAFDIVDHVILLDKPHAYGLDNTSLSWFQSYLSDRREFVSMSGKESTRSIGVTVMHPLFSYLTYSNGYLSLRMLH